MKNLKESDPEIFSIIEKEKLRQMTGLEMIPSENLASKAVLEALGSCLNNKYSEGYPGKRYYGGNELIDKAEQLAVDRAKQLFGAEHVNVQPYSGSPANLEAIFSLVDRGDKIMGMKLADGGHLTHGSHVNFSGKLFTVVPYGVDKETELIDYDEVLKIAKLEKPKLIISGFTAYPRTLDFKAFDEIAQEIGAYSMADIAHIAGLIAAGVLPSPVKHADIVTTTTHKTLRGPRGAMIMCKQIHAEKVDKAVFPMFQGGPHNHANAAKAVAFGEALQPEFKAYAKQTIKNAQALADALLSYGFRLVTGGTDNHLILLDLQNKNITGKDAEKLLETCGIFVNKNMIPYDPRKPWDPSGIRLGTPCLTTRGMKQSEMKDIGEMINKAVENRDNSDILQKIKSNVEELCSRFRFYD